MVGIICLALAIPLARRKIPMNVWYGVRIQKAFQSERLWYEINAFFGRKMIRASVAVLVAGFSILLIPVKAIDNPLLLVPVLILESLGPMLIFTVIAAMRTVEHAATLAPEDPTSPVRPDVGYTPEPDGNNGWIYVLISLLVFQLLVFLPFVVFAISRYQAAQK
jgi:hypothetical protein